jgi:hypothetical protein
MIAILKKSQNWCGYTYQVSENFVFFLWIINDLLTASSLLVLSSRLPVVWGFSNNQKL